MSGGRDAILAAWRRRIWSTYPAPTADLLASGRDRFRNPAGDAIRRGTEATLDALLRGASREELAAAVDPIVRLRAVQELTPSQAVGFVFALRDALRDAKAPDDLAAGIDALALAAFDVYSECRERIASVRVAEAKARFGQLLSRAERKVGG